MTEEMIVVTTTVKTPDAETIEGVVAAQIRPLLHVHGGDIDVLSVSDAGHVELQFQGACKTCVLKSVTYAIAVRERLLQYPGVTSVEVHGVNLSEAALARASMAYAGHSLMLTAKDTALGPQQTPRLGGLERP
ncbi:NifU family protein [Mycobacterium spongiae]|uniref:NIF system FeS cluster assembly NifU C-terminal domain-containing protein n=1 Tax=Mycobacterium spongiae TaxID=886343 RepID=A0A975JVG5_9MYCO|nr:NifU family protein [Mycobacterium spongiae]QUR66406.1 hypothetical protein F6B93_04270 [Mycobacterium spongiae]